MSKFVYVSVASSVQDAFGEAIIKPYFKGKTSSNQAVTSVFGKNGVLVKPSFIYGGDKFELSPPRVRVSIVIAMLLLYYIAMLEE